jgi:hypothetical protein
VTLALPKNRRKASRYLWRWYREVLKGLSLPKHRIKFWLKQIRHNVRYSTDILFLAAEEAELTDA